MSPRAKKATTRRSGGSPPAAKSRPTGTRRRDHEVLDAAARVFYERGYSGATMQDIADELGILKGSVYYYIETKEDLLFRLLEQVHVDVERIVAEVQALDGLDTLARLEEYVRRQVRHNLTHLRPVSVYYNDVERLGAERLALIRERRRPPTRFVTELIAQAQADGRVDPSLDPHILANCVFGTFISSYRWYRPRGEWSVERVAEHCARVAISGISGAPLLVD